MLNNSRCMIAHSTGKYGSNSALKQLLFQSNRNSNSLYWRQLSSSQIASSTPVESAPAQPKSASPPQPQQAPKKSGSSSFKITALALTGFTVGLGFATLNPDSRRQIQKAVPQSNQLFDMIDELLGRKKSSITSFPSCCHYSTASG